MRSTSLALVEMVEQRTRELVTAAIQLGPLGPARLGQADDPHAAVVGVTVDGDQVLILEPAQQPAEVSGVEAEPAPDGARVRACLADLVENPGCPSGRGRARYSSLSAPSRCVTTRLNRLTVATPGASIF